MTFNAPADALTFSESEKSPLSIRAKALVFVDPLSQQLRERAEQLAGSGQPLLIEGESGTGKELLARYIHRQSERGGLFVAVNCLSLSRQFGEAELFGHTGGAQAGAPGSRAGWFGSANGGTLYLDEVADLSRDWQTKLLSVLETREVYRVGASQPLPIDVRLIAASSLELRRAVEAGRFDEQLYAYLCDGHLTFPALRRRVGDILPLAEYFIGIHAQRLQLPVVHLSAEAQALLIRHAWPGNTRELESAIHLALLLADGEEIRPEHLLLSGRD